MAEIRRGEVSGLPGLVHLALGPVEDGAGRGPPPEGGGSWTLDLFLPPHLVNLGLGASQGVTREHYEPGQEVFREGDLGDRLYIILKGEAEVRRGTGSEEAVLARLGPGQCFGEMALVNTTTRNATVRCVEALDVLSMPRPEFSVLAANLPDLRRSFERMAEERAASATAVTSA